MRLAVFSPLPPRRSGIADYTQELVARMADHAHVDLWVESDHPPPERVGDLPVIRYAPGDAHLEELGSYDGIVYHLGNDAQFHAALYDVFSRWPGIVVLHDFVLHHFFYYYFVVLLELPDAYREELEYAHGAAGAAFAERVLRGDLEALGQVDAESFPLNLRALDAASAVVVHSDFSLRLAREARPELPLRKIFHFGPSLGATDRRTVRRRLELPADVPILASFGHFVAAKRIDVALEALARLDRTEFLYLLVGQPDPRLALPSLVRRLGLEERVRFVDWVDLPTMNLYLEACDVVVNLRHPNMGETSGVVCRALAAGTPCIVSEGGWFDELPGECVVRVPVGAGEADAVAGALERLLASPRAREALGAAAKRYSERYHGIDATAAAYVELASGLAAAGEPLATRQISRVARELAAMGVQENDTALLRPVARLLDEVFGPETASEDRTDAVDPRLNSEVLPPISGGDV